MKFGLLFLTIVGVFLGLFFVVRFFDRMPPINEKTKTCLVTGASSGIGREMVREMVRRGWKVIGVARRAQLLNELERQLGPDYFIPYVCDVKDAAAVHKVSEEIKARGLLPTLFFLNAGAGDKDFPYKFSTQQHRNTFNTNYFGVLAWVEEWLNTVNRNGGGTFVATSSVVSLFAMPGVASYSTSKAALNACFQSLRLQYRNDGIGFVTVIPGPVKTEMLKAATAFPFTHQPDDEACYIVQQVFNGKKQIEPSWLYACVFRLISWLPDGFIIRMTTDSKKDFLKPKIDQDKWNAQHYKKYSQGQFALGMQLVNELNLNGSENVLDLGCGDGRITAEVAKKVSQGYVLGVDISCNMISEAQKSFRSLKNLEFQCCDAVQFTSDKKFEKAFINAAFHWIKDQRGALKNIYNHLKDGGILIINMPAIENGPIQQVHESKKWAPLLARNGETFFPHTVESMSALLRNCGYVDVNVTQNVDSMIFNDEEELFNCLFAWIPHSTGLPDEKAREFTHDIIELIRKANPDGTLMLDSALLHARAVKPDK